MAIDQAVFPYTDEQLAALDKTLSVDRLKPYLILGNNDRRLAIKLYEWNTALSESFYGVLQGLEIALRNSMHNVLCDEFNKNDWYDICPLQDEQRDAVRKAKARILHDNKQVLPCKVVAELTFGFWVALTGPKYAQGVWDKCLHKSFTRKLGRKALHKRLDKIRKLRNRVAHHESILDRQLKNDFSLILETVHWICPTTARWLKAINSFHSRYTEKPILDSKPSSNADRT